MLFVRYIEKRAAYRAGNVRQDLIIVQVVRSSGDPQSHKKMLPVNIFFTRDENNQNRNFFWRLVV